MNINYIKMSMKILAIGDMHYSIKTLPQLVEVEKFILSHIGANTYDMIVGLGDWMHNHSKLDLRYITPCFNFINKLKERCKKLVLLVGNHDRITNQEDPDNLHAFGAFEGVIVVDKAQVHKIGEFKFLFMPYLPNNMFWTRVREVCENYSDVALCFAHQEFVGCNFGHGIFSENGTKIKQNFPAIVSGHIHEMHTVNNIFYPGTPYQTAIDENINKFICDIELTGLSRNEWKKTSDTQYINDNTKITLIPVEGRTKHINIKISISELPTLQVDDKNFYRIKVSYKNDSELITSNRFKELKIKSNVKISGIKEQLSKLTVQSNSKFLNYLTVLEQRAKELNLGKIFDEIYKNK